VNVTAPALNLAPTDRREGCCKVLPQDQTGRVECSRPLISTCGGEIVGLPGALRFGQIDAARGAGKKKKSRTRTSLLFGGVVIISAVRLKGPARHRHGCFPELRAVPVADGEENGSSVSRHSNAGAGERRRSLQGDDLIGLDGFEVRLFRASSPAACAAG